MLSIFPLPIKTHIKKVEWKTKGENLTSHSLLSAKVLDSFVGFREGFGFSTHTTKS